MKTPFDIDQTVMQKLQEEAARRGVPVSALVESGLRQVLVEGKPADGQPAALPPLPTWRSGGFRVDIDSRETLCRAMEDAPCTQRNLPLQKMQLRWQKF